MKPIAVGSVACTIDTSFAGAATPKKKNIKEEVDSSSTSTEEPEKVAVTQEIDTGGFENVKVSPVAKKMMAENELSVEDVINGLRRIGKSDIEAVRDMATNDVVSPQEPAAATRTEERQKMSNLRKKLSKRLVAVKNENGHAHYLQRGGHD